jgi:pimeloyl-ACP methyl ester carboxylesterase
MNMVQLGSGAQLSWQEYGQSTGFPVFYFHGLPGSSLEPKPADTIIKELGVRIIAIDRMGYGHSTSGDGVELPEFSEAVSEIANSLNLNRYSLLGFSGGVPFALACAFNLNNQVDKVAIVSGVADFTTEVMLTHYNPDFKALFELAATDPDLAKHHFEALAPTTQSMMELMGANLPADDQRIFGTDAFYGHYFKNLDIALNQGVRGMMNDAKVIGVPWPINLREIRVPTTIWHGEEDLNCNVAISDYFANSIPNARLNILPGKGHFFIFEHWREVLSDLIKGFEDGIA